MNWNDRIVLNPDILLGKPVIKGSRLAVEFIIELLAQGWSEEDILRTYGLGVNSFITKPVSFDDLVRIVQTLCNYWIEIVVLPPECQSVKVEV